MTPSAKPSPPSSGLKRAMLIFVGSIAVLDAIAIGVYYAFHIALRPDRDQHIFIGVWMGLTLAVVVRNLTKIRAYRGRYRPGG